MDFVDTVVTNIFSVAKQAGSTAKAIFNTLQAIDEVHEKHRTDVISIAFSFVLDQSTAYGRTQTSIDQYSAKK